MNTELAANDGISKFKHDGFYNPSLGAMHSYIILLRDEYVSITALEKPSVLKSLNPCILSHDSSFQSLKSQGC